MSARVVSTLMAVAALLSAPGGAQAAHSGGAATFMTAADVDYLDPGLTYYTFGYMVQHAVNRPLYSFRPGQAAPVPDLAEGPPQVSDDGRTVTVRLRGGVRYAPPVGREVVAGDVEYAIERAFFDNVANGYATTYFSELEGARPHAAAGRDIPGVEAVDDRTLVLRLTAPVGEMVAAALAMPITVPVPREVAAPRDRFRPSTYDDAVAFTGPYMVTSWERGRRMELGRNPNWDPATDFRPAYLDSITILEGRDDLVAASRRALRGSRLMCCDGSAPTSRALVRRYGAQVGRVPSGGSRWIALNTRIEPFDDVDVRRAVVAGMDRRALLESRGAPGSVAQHFLPPGLPGFAESGGARGFRDLDFLRHPGGNRSLARRYLRRAGYRDGRYSGRRRLLMVGTNADPGRATAREAARQLRRLGFRIRLALVPQNVAYTVFCGVPRARVAICANVGWFKDIHDAEAMLRPTFSGAEIKPAGNFNWSQLRVPAIDRAMDAAEAVPAGPERDAAWGRINHDVSAQAPGVPYAWEDAVQFASADLEAAMNPYSTTWDLAFTGLR